VCVCVCVFCRIDLLRFFFSVSLSFFVEDNPRRPGGVGVCSVFSDLTWCSIPGCFSYGTQWNSAHLSLSTFGCFISFWALHLHLRSLWPGGLFGSFLVCEQLDMSALPESITVICWYVIGWTTFMCCTSAGCPTAVVLSIYHILAEPYLHRKTSLDWL
jgi:hypothetical protein